VVLGWDVSSVMTAFSSIRWLGLPEPRVGRFQMAASTADVDGMIDRRS
jgi:hypothetical protein